MSKNRELDRLCLWLKSFEAALARLAPQLLSPMPLWAHIEEFYLVDMSPAIAARAYVRRVSLYGLA